LQDRARRRKQILPRVDVTITIFCDFKHFSAEKMAFFLKTRVTMHFV
jgi:hypothetical protein